MKKIAITGHTRGIGGAVYTAHQSSSVGFSRSNGYDIRNDLHRKAIVEQAADCDVFINNAYHGWAQVDLLYMMADLWKRTDKLIINISSNSGDGIKKKSHVYAVHKTALDKAAEQLSRLDDSCRICTLRPGYIDTYRVSHVKDNKIPVDQILDVINWIMQCPNNYNINSLTIIPRNTTHDTV